MSNPVLSVVMPVYNEQDTLREILRRVLAVQYPFDYEVVAVDDGSSDGTKDILHEYESKGLIRLVDYDGNKGKGYAVRAGINSSEGSIIVIQDADLEYDPRDIPALIQPILAGRADVVYGNRFKGNKTNWRIPHHYIGNRLLSLATSILYLSWVSDMETCYKAARKTVITQLNLESNGFDIEPEITSKILGRGIKIHEVPVRFNPRDFDEGKKITWRDGVKALLKLIKLRFNLK